LDFEYIELADGTWFVHDQEKVFEKPIFCSESILFAFLTHLGFLKYTQLRSVPSPPLSDELRQCCRDRLLSCLGDLCNQIVAVTEGQLYFSPVSLQVESCFTQVN
jgi:hypothetical protein